MSAAAFHAGEHAHSGGSFPGPRALGLGCNGGVSRRPVRRPTPALGGTGGFRTGVHSRHRHGEPCGAVPSRWTGPAAVEGARAWIPVVVGLTPLSLRADAQERPDEPMGHTARGSVGRDREVRHLLNAAAGAGASARLRRLGWSRRRRRGGREPPCSCGANEQRRSTLPQMRSNPAVHGSINLASGPRSRVTSAGRSSAPSGREDL